MSVAPEIGWLPTSLLRSRFDANFNRASAVEARAKIDRNSSAVDFRNICTELVCGPFGSTILSSDIDPSGDVVWVRPTEISGSHFQDDGQSRITEIMRVDRGLELYGPETMLFARVGVYPHCGVLPATIGKATISSAIIAARVDRAQSDPYFLMAFFRTRVGKIILFSIQKVTAQPVIGTEELSSAVVPCPQVSLQRSIGHKVRAAEQLRAAAEAAKKGMRSSFPAFVLQTRPLSGQWLSDHVVDTERLEAQYYQPHFLEMMNVIDSLPGKVVPLQQLVGSTRHGASVTGANTVGGRVRFIRGTEIGANRISTDDVVYLNDASIAELASSHFVKAGDLLVTRSGTVGTCAVARAREIGVAFGSFVIAVQIESDGDIAPEYVAAFLNSSLGQAQYRREENGAVQMNINNGELGRIRIPLFTADFREQIIKHVETFNSNLDRSELLVKSAITDVENLIDGKLDEAACIAEGRKLAEEFALEVP